MDARRAAVTALRKIDEQGGYSHIVLDELLDKLPPDAPERALTARLLYGVTERRLTLDHLLNRCSSTPVKNMDPAIREILRVGVYQLVYMDTPAFAAINEAVRLTREMAPARLAGFVNAVLHRVEREASALLNGLPDTDKGKEIRYSCPRAWIRLWRDAYGDDSLTGLLDRLNDAPPAYIRVNTRVTAPTEFMQVLREAGIGAQPVEGLPAALKVDEPQKLRSLPPELQNAYYFQDIASQWCCAALDAHPGERIADVCAAPGGKSLTVAQIMEDSGTVDAADLYPQKCAIITERAARYGLHCVTAVCRDATAPVGERAGQYDRVLCDAPCSGLGVIRRKPEIRYKTTEELDGLPDLQKTILSRAAELVRPGGVLQYSTCTLNPAENERVAADFLATHPDFSPRLLPIEPCFAAAGSSVSHQITLFPAIHGSDGFFIAGFTRHQ